LKDKDLRKIWEYAASISHSGTFSFKDNHKPYRVYHEFADRIRTQYPAYTAMWRLYNLLDELFFNGLISDKLVPRKIWNRVVHGK
jgi:hypothetical protein